MIVRAVLLAAALLGAAAAEAGGLVETIRRVKPAVVGITLVPVAGRPAVPALAGTGFAIADGRHVVTNLHVVEPEGRAAPITVYAVTAAGPDRRDARVVARDAVHDLALVRIEGTALPALRLAADARAEEGASIAITGFPIGPALGLVPATNAGIIAAITPARGSVPHSSMITPEMLRAPPFILYQLDMVAFPGNSGSPAYLAETGEVIGIVAAGFIKRDRERMLRDPSGISFAVPARYIADLVRQAGLTP